jgi:hypothetical protein
MVGMAQERLCPPYACFHCRHHRGFQEEMIMFKRIKGAL